MRKDTAIKLMKDGVKIRHERFSDDEWMTIKHGKIVFEDGCICDIELFWKDRTSDIWESGYHIVDLSEMKIENWDWKRALPSDIWYDIVLDGFPCFEIDNYTKEPYYHSFGTKDGEQKSSRKIAVEFDDVSEGLFYYRDFTDDGIPFVRDGDVYRSCFSFQFKKDYDKFFEMFLKTR